MRKGVLDSFVDRMSKGENPDNGGEGTRPLGVRSPTVRRFSEAFEDITAHAIKDINTDLIGNSALNDRFDVDDDIAGLIQSIKQNGQKIPVLLRPASSGAEDGVIYQPVYGRRRIAAARALGIPVRAQIGNLDDTEALIAQGLENSARKDTSFIERAMFARDLLDAGLDTESVANALTTDKSTVARLNAITKAIPHILIKAIGPAPGMGRGRWSKLKIACQSADESHIKNITLSISKIGSSDDRLLAAIAEFSSSGEPPAPPENTKSERSIGTFRMISSRKEVHLKATPSSNPDFLAYLAERMEEIHHEWLSGAEEEDM